MAGSGLTFGGITDAVGAASRTLENNLRGEIENMKKADTIDTADMLKLQQVMQQWTMMTQVQSTVVKELGDTLKGIIQKAA